MRLDVKFTESNQDFDVTLNTNERDELKVNFDGVQTIHGKDGKDGESAYQIATNNGFVGTEEEWLESLHGRDGVDGKDGRDGIDGRNGIDGKDGIDGKNGVDGKDGRDGIDGINGKDGKDGKDGYTPQKGTDYFDGKDGADGHSPIKGTDYFTEADKTEMVNAVKTQLIVEQWTFTLTDDTVVTKDVIVE